MITRIKKQITQIIFIALLILFINLFSYAKDEPEKKNDIDLNKIKQEIKSELEGNIREIVREEIKGYFAQESENKSADTSEIGKVVQEELDEYTAGAEENKIDIPVGPKALKPANTQQSESHAVVSKPKAIEETLQRRGTMLLQKGKALVETGFTTAHFSSNRINIQGFSILPLLVVGTISTEKVQRDIFISSVSMKYGLFNNLQTEVNIPYRHEFDRVTNDVGVEYTRSAGGIGDVAFGVSRQIGFERGLIPDTVASISIKTRTGQSLYNRDIGLGTGHYSLKNALIFAKSNDPAVIFGSLSYTWNIKDTIDGYGEVDPGDAVGYSIGTAIALSYQTAINFQLLHDITLKMKKDNVSVNGSFLNSASLKYGFTWSISERTSIDMSASHGLTTDSPDYSIEVRIPYRF